MNRNVWGVLIFAAIWKYTLDHVFSNTFMWWGPIFWLLGISGAVLVLRHVAATRQGEDAERG